MFLKILLMKKLGEAGLGLDKNTDTGKIPLS